MHTEYLLAVFRSRQQATAFYQNLKRVNLVCDMISSPASLARGCGVSVRFQKSDFEKIRILGGWQKMSAFDGFYRYDKKTQRFIQI